MMNMVAAWLPWFEIWCGLLMLLGWELHHRRGHQPLVRRFTFMILHRALEWQTQVVHPFAIWYLTVVVDQAKCESAARSFRIAFCWAVPSCSLGQNILCVYGRRSPCLLRWISVKKWPFVRARVMFHSGALPFSPMKEADKGTVIPSGRGVDGRPQLLARWGALPLPLPAAP